MLAVDEIAHGRRAPLQRVGDAQLRQQVEGGVVRLADEVVVALDAEAAEIEVRRHAAGLGVDLIDRHFMAGLQGVVGGGQAHGAGADDGKFSHCGKPFGNQKSRTTPA
jgi:hypothetical protein